MIQSPRLGSIFWKGTKSLASHFRITECGNYYLHVLSNRFSYIDLVLADTPIADIDLVKRLRSMLPTSSLETRFQRSELFIKYPKEMEEREIRFDPDYRNSPLAKYEFTRKIEQSFAKERKYIRERSSDRDSCI